MKVTDKREFSKVPINELDEGNVFELSGEFWIKTDNVCKDATNYVTCIELTCGHFARFEHNTLVVPCLETEMVIRG